MPMQSIQAIVPAVGTPPSPAPGNPIAPTAAFADWFERELSEVNHQLLASDTAVRKLALGEITNLHQIMMELEKAKLSFSLVVQVRNRLMEGYQDILRMQV